MSLDEPFGRALMDRLANGDGRAAEVLVARYSPELRNFIKPILDRYYQLCRVCNPSDVLQETWASFFRQVAAGRNYDLDTEADLLAFLKAVARNQAAKSARHYLTAAKRDLRRQTPLDAANDVEEWWLNPARVAEYKDVITKCLSRLSEHERTLFEMRYLDECSLSEIAKRLDADRRSVSRSLENVAARIDDVWRWP